MECFLFETEELYFEHVLFLPLVFFTGNISSTKNFWNFGSFPNIGRLFPHFYYSLSACRCGNQLKPEEIQALWVCLCLYSKDLLRSDNCWPPQPGHPLLLLSGRSSQSYLHDWHIDLYLQLLMDLWLLQILLRLSLPTQLTSSFGLMQYPEDYNLSLWHILKYSIGRSPAHWRGTCILSFL